MSTIYELLRLYSYPMFREFITPDKWLVICDDIRNKAIQLEHTFSSLSMQIFTVSSKECLCQLICTSLSLVGNCIFCEGVTSEIFLAENILDFARNLPANPHIVVKRRDSRTVTKDQAHFTQSEKQQVRSADKAHAEQSPIGVVNNGGNSSDDESDSVDIGHRRRRRNRPKSERDKLTQREPKSPAKIRSLSEAISDIEARTRAAKREMDYRATHSQSESDNKTDVSSNNILQFHSHKP